jgi:hypothetical protein
MSFLPKKSHQTYKVNGLSNVEGREEKNECQSKSSDERLEALRGHRLARVL